MNSRFFLIDKLLPWFINEYSEYSKLLKRLCGNSHKMLGFEITLNNLKTQMTEAPLFTLSRFDDEFYGFISVMFNKC